MAQLWRVESLHPFTPAFKRVAGATLLAAGAGGALAWVASLLPTAAAMPLIIAIAAASIWTSARFALPLADRRSLGKTARRLRLVAS